MMNEQKILPALSSLKDVEEFAASNFEICVLMNIHLALLDTAFLILARNNKKCLLHIDLIDGLSNNESGVQYICQKYHPYGLITTKHSLVKLIKRYDCIAILRLFLIDSNAIKKGIEQINKVIPDYVEVLPGICSSIYPKIKAKLPCDMIVGGLITSKEEIRAALNCDVKAITISLSSIKEL